MNFDRASEVYSEAEFYEPAQMPRNSREWTQLRLQRTRSPSPPPPPAVPSSPSPPPPAIPARNVAPNSNNNSNANASPATRPVRGQSRSAIVVVSHRLPSVRQMSRKTVTFSAPPLSPTRAPPLPPTVSGGSAGSGGSGGASHVPSLASQPPPLLAAAAAAAPVVKKPRPVSKRNVRLTLSKPSDVKKRTIVAPSANSANGRNLIIDERSVAQRSSVMRLRPALCEMCGARVPVARLSRNGFNFWSCKLCVRAARDEFVQFGTLSRARFTIKTRSPSALSRATLPAPSTAPAAAFAPGPAAIAAPAATLPARHPVLAPLESAYNVHQTMTKPAPLVLPPRSPERAEVASALAQLPARPAPSPQAQVRRGPVPPAQRMPLRQQQQVPARVAVAFPIAKPSSPPPQPHQQQQQQQSAISTSPRSGPPQVQQQQQQQSAISTSPRSGPPQVPPPHQPSSSPTAPLKPKLTPLGFALDISDIEELPEPESTEGDRTASYTEVSMDRVTAAEDDGDDDDDGADSVDLEALYDRFTLRRSYATVGAAKPFDIAAINDAAAAASTNKQASAGSLERDTSSFRLMHGDVHSVHFFDNEEEIFAQLDDLDDNEELPPIPVE